MNTNTSVPFDQSAACERCGHFGAFKFDGETLCTDCYGARASCCAEFAGDDLSNRSPVVSTAPRVSRDQPPSPA